MALSVGRGLRLNQLSPHLETSVVQMVLYGGTHEPNYFLVQGTPTNTSTAEFSPNDSEV